MSLADIEDVYQELIEDNIVAVSRQMIDKEASTSRPEDLKLSNGKGAAANGHAEKGANGDAGGDMDVDEEL